MIKCGGLEEGARFELIDGLLLDMSPKSPEHEKAIAWLMEWIIDHEDRATPSAPGLRGADDRHLRARARPDDHRAS